MENLKRLKDYIIDKKYINIFGAGNVGGKIVRFICSEMEKECIEKIYVSDKKNAPDSIEGISVEEFKTESYNNTAVVIAVSGLWRDDSVSVLDRYNISDIAVLSDDFEYILDKHYVEARSEQLITKILP